MSLNRVYDNKQTTKRILNEQTIASFTNQELMSILEEDSFSICTDNSANVSYVKNAVAKFEEVIRKQSSPVTKVMSNVLDLKISDNHTAEIVNIKSVDNLPDENSDFSDENSDF